MKVSIEQIARKGAYGKDHKENDWNQMINAVKIKLGKSAGLSGVNTVASDNVANCASVFVMEKQFQFMEDKCGDPDLFIKEKEML